MSTLGIDEVTIGASASGVETYIEELKLEYIDEAIAALQDLSEVKATLEAGWQGVSQQRFIAALEDNSNNVVETLNGEYVKLQSALTSVAASFFDHDENLIQG